ncbi:hypothetical protein [Nocardia arthritidis]|nr:hypothetical protein [Nocardia arthritidis]
MWWPTAVVSVLWTVSTNVDLVLVVAGVGGGAWLLVRRMGVR